MKKVQKEEEIKKEVVCEKCGYNNCSMGNCGEGYCHGGVCSYHCRPGRNIWWKIVSVFFRIILMLIILAIVFALGAAVGGAGAVSYMNGDDYVFGPGMMSGSGVIGDWDYKAEKLLGIRSGMMQRMQYSSLDTVKQNSAVRIFGNIVSVGAGDLVISDNAGKDLKVISGSLTIIETSKGEIGIKDLRIDEGVTVYGVLVNPDTIKAYNIKLSR